jgi:hypothetical protein
MSISRLPTKNTDTSVNTRAGGDRLRIALADAIQGAAKIRHAAERHRAGAERTRSSVAAAEAELEKALAGVGKAQEAHIAALAHAAASGTSAPASKVRAARQLVIDCEDEVSAQRAALAQMRADLPNWDKEVALADTDVEAAISAILAPMAEKLIERGREIAAQFAPIRSALNALWFDPSPANHDEALAFEQSRKPLVETKEAVAEFLRTTTRINRVEPDAWIEARSRLRADAYSELPELDTLLSGEPAE